VYVGFGLLVKNRDSTHCQIVCPERLVTKGNLTSLAGWAKDLALPHSTAVAGSKNEPTEYSTTKLLPPLAWLGRSFGRTLMLGCRFRRALVLRDWLDGRG